MKSTEAAISVTTLARRLGDPLMGASCLAALLLGVGSLLFMPLYVLVEAYPVLGNEGGVTGFLFTRPWRPLAAPPEFGILHSWVSTLMITAICLALALPLGYGIGLFVSEIAPRFVQAILQSSLQILAGIPSVVYGFFGYVTLLPLFESHLDMPAGESILAAAIILSIMVLPFVASTSAEAFRAVPAETKEAAFAQGVTRWHVIRRVVIPRAAPGMFAGAVLGFARAIGETLAVLMLAGNSLAVPTGVLDRGQPLTALIATELGEAGVGSRKFHALFAAGLILVVITVIINAGIWALKVKWVRPSE